MSKTRAPARSILAKLTAIEQQYEADGEYPPEQISLAASSAMYVIEREPGFTRATIRHHLACVDIDATVTATVLAELRGMAR